MGMRVHDAQLAARPIAMMSQQSLAAGGVCTACKNTIDAADFLR